MAAAAPREAALLPQHRLATTPSASPTASALHSALASTAAPEAPSGAHTARWAASVDTRLRST